MTRASAWDVVVDLTSLDTFCRFTGTGRYVSELGRALQALSPSERQGLAIAGLTSIDGADPMGPLDWAGSQSIRYDVEHETAWLNARRTRLVRTLRRVRPRLFHAPYHMGTPRGSAVPRVVTCHDFVRLALWRDYMPDRPVYRRLLRAAEAMRFHGARRVIAISQFTADDAMRLLGLPASKIDVVYHGADLDRYRPPSGPAEIEQARATRARYGLPEGGYVFYAGAADPRKNVDVVIRAFAEARVDGLELVVVGRMRPSDQRAIDRAMQDAGQPAGVRFVGFVPEPDLPAIISGALGFVFCSTYEGFGQGVVEAMAAGCPVITTGLTSIGEVAGDAALRIPPRDVRATADAIRRIARDVALRADLTRAGLRRAQRFTWRQSALGTVDSYARALR
jgi:glycosyltransferase involved in cell wall biosynthesis